MTLSPPSGRSSRTTDDHQHQEDELRKERPFFRRSITKTGGGDDIGNLEEGNLKTLSDIGIEMKDIVSDQDTGHEDDGDIGPQFLIFKEGLEFSDHEEVVEVKVNPED